MPEDELYGEHDVHPVEFIRADKLPEKGEYISTGSPDLDAVIGGVEVGKLTEVAGPFGSGKTQTCFTCAVLNPGNTFFADTEGTFKPSRIQQIASARGLSDPSKRIFVERMESSLAIDYWVHHRLEKMLNFKKYEPIRLVIIDSLISHYRAEYVGRENLPVRQGAINKLLHKLTTLAEHHQFAVLYTNQAVASPDYFTGDKPAGGNIIAHASHLRLWVRRAKKISGMRRYMLRVLDSPYIAEVECPYMINEGGIVNVKKKKKDKYASGDAEGADTKTA